MADLVLSLPDGLEIAPDVAERLRAAAVQIASLGRRGRRPLTKEARQAFLVGIAAGLDVDDAAEFCGRALSTLYQARNRDPEFARQWAEALEAGCAPVERRMRAIALTGNPESMATIRAAEVFLRTRHPNFGPPKPASASVKMDASAGTFSVNVGQGFAD